MQDFSSENDAELLVFMSVKDDDPLAARDAWAEFYERHVEYLHGMCWRACADLLHGDASVGDLVAETFRRAFDRAGTFSCEDASGPDEIRRRVRGWLGRIAQRLLQDILRGHGRLDVIHVEQEVWQQIPQPEPSVSAEGPEIERVREALQRLPEREQLVIRVTFQWYRPGREHQRLPKAVVEDLAATLRTTPENLRQIRRRALERIRRYLKEPVRPTEAVPAGEWT
ncbi:MAG: sigma-70 family RNA polymerase sigma factor [Lentisphaerae bacterium]|nr:sigma-70 family RNA polymerase sigma factor [Lentisphaerota bacterium]MBT4814866.1 sigma-70 family RNA polymerase sigma factor [Lentisphaerota bacterium]MBT5611980.1 sigma-70 family RNA polymerase sigma factor [Lentisphaerota bacterium]MBT7060900.1 sigma-70 family RNA polymerase sigma factor [Lentisphaerota bacterium]MBT7847739.1 sigma-70 family RNA polymerase sigma factor [Lentisphaerota bacterium]